MQCKWSRWWRRGWHPRETPEHDFLLKVEVLQEEMMRVRLVAHRQAGGARGSSWGYARQSDTPMHKRQCRDATPVVCRPVNGCPEGAVCRRDKHSILRQCDNVSWSAIKAGSGVVFWQRQARVGHYAVHAIEDVKVATGDERPCIRRRRHRLDRCRRRRVASWEGRDTQLRDR